MASNSRATHVVVWEWEFSFDLWLPYDVEAVHLIEHAHRSKKRHIKLSGRLACYELDLSAKMQTRTDTGTLRRIRRNVYPIDSLPGKGSILWEWESDFGWLPYSLSTACILESAHERNDTLVDLSKTELNIPNTVDLNQREQINHHTHTCRQVQRTALHKLYPLADSSDSHLSLNLERQASSGPNSPVVYKFPSHGSPPTSIVSSSPWGTQNRNTPSAGSSLPTQPLPVNSQETASASWGASQNSEQRKKLKTLHKNDSSDPLSKFCSRVQVSSDEECSICCDKLSAPSNFDDDLNSGDSPHDIKRLEKCGHLFHSLCLTAMYNSGLKDGSLQCPVCKTIHGVKYGTQPSTGTMHVVTSPRPSLPGHPGCGIITITYDFNPGKQGPEHPNPGKHFNARGFPRVCYLPDNSKGQKVLELLKTAWERRLVFTIGTSNTTGQPDTVVWNEIHHKTEAFSNHSGHGYPDPNYLDNVLAELATHGVEDNS